eukprot:TRINITY_DN61254_c0_g1_i1.p1 TRINITY_DN61254_c0_g1~~TRINITY_DN61254_c0_g1_i1.p1  ORF type:complete len:868 (+),score=148.15 TRINITY_DN61254_c0_g1_i1:80-2683(+)
MYVPLQALAAGLGRQLPQACVRVELLGLEGRAAAAAEAFASCSELCCEIYCGLASGVDQEKTGGPKLNVTLRIAASDAAAAVTVGCAQLVHARVSLAPNEKALVFQLADFDLRRAVSAGGLCCRVRLWQKTLQGPRRFLGDACIAVPTQAARGTCPLGNGGIDGLALRADAAWGGLDNSQLEVVAGKLGEHILGAAARRQWQEVTALAHLASSTRGGWGKPVAEQCRALVVGRTDEQARTALHLCVLVPDTGHSDLNASAAATAAVALVAGRADPHQVAAGGDTPLTAALRAGAPFSTMLVPLASPSVIRAVGLSPLPPWVRSPVDWEVLRDKRAFGMILFAAEQLTDDPGPAAPRPPPPGGGGSIRREPSSPGSAFRGVSTQALPIPARSGAADTDDSARTQALRDVLFHAVSRRLLPMSLRVLRALPPLRGRASSADVLLLEQMTRRASGDGAGDSGWFDAAKAQLNRGTSADAWQSGRRVVRALADLAAKGVEQAQELMVEVVLPECGALSDEPRDLYPERAAECAVCFEPLFENFPAYFLDEAGQRSCVHYVCGGCADSCLTTKECPICRALAASFLYLPDVEVDPRAWFAAASRGDGRLDHAELCHAMAACLPVSEERLLEAVEAKNGLWRQYWDTNHNGWITEEEFFAPNVGLFAWLIAHLRELHHNELRSRTSAPDLRSDPASWFDFWDVGSSGELSFGEVLRGVFVSRRLSALEDKHQLDCQRAEVHNCWRDSGLADGDRVAREDFLRPRGLAEAISNSLKTAEVPAGSVPLAALKKQVTPGSSPMSRSCSELPKAVPPPLPLAPEPPEPEPVVDTYGFSGANLDALDTLEAMGFPRDRAADALHKANGNADAAAAMLL